MSSKPRFALVLLGTVALAGCNTAYRDIGSPDPGFGEAVKFNAAVQTVNPDPVYSDLNAQPGDNAERSVEAMERYREGEVREIEEVTTTTGTTGSGGGGSR